MLAYVKTPGTVHSASLLCFTAANTRSTNVDQIRQLLNRCQILDIKEVGDVEMIDLFAIPQMMPSEICLFHPV